MKRTLFLSIFSLFLISTNTILSQTEFPSFISNNMVLQQQTEAPIWGWAEKGMKIKIQCNWEDSEYFAIADDTGKWQTKVKTPEAGGPFTITVNEDTIENVLIGEVWICSGQSNMKWELEKSIGGLEEIEKANYPEIRLFYAARQIGDKPQDDCYGNWVECTPKSASSFSAVAYYFGKKLYKELNVPIGLIHTSWGGSPAQAWVKEEIMKSDPDYQIYYDRQKKNELKAKPGILPLSQYSPSRLYNAMIHPLIPFAIKGAIWYQGESNRSEAILYEKLFPTMIKNWRDDWQQGNFPFYYVQIAPYNYNVPVEGALLRDAQRKTLSVPNTGMAVTMDIGNPNDIHPRNKVDVGERLALWALAKDYGKERIVFSGPLYNSIKSEGNKARIYFDYIGSGLMAKGEELTHFEIAGSDKIFYPAKAAIDGKTVLVKSEEVDNPVAVRYAFHNTDEPNLFNNEGLPASSFRTDDWIIVTDKSEISSNYQTEQNQFLVKIKTNTNSSEIRYTLDGTMPNQNSYLYDKAFSVSGPVTITSRVFVNKVPSVYVAQCEILQHKATGKKATYINKYSDKYSGGGEFALVNSMKGSDDFTDGFWQGFEGDDLEVIVDLEEELKISTVSIGCLQSIGAWIFFPKTLQIEVSKDGSNFEKVAQVTNNISKREEGDILEIFEAKVNNTSARYIKIVAENVGVCPEWHPGAGGKAWIFIDEIIIE
ncbi:MAG: sialate O-acetylesterase [Bacteroidota bacterium]